MSLYKKLFQQTAIYGLATVVPRLMSFLLNPLYVYYLSDKSKMGEVSVIFSYLVFFNVVLSYGMETAFFRFYNTEDDKKKVISTSMISLLSTTTLFLIISYLFKENIAQIIGINVEFIKYTIFILVLDALVIIPFSKLRAESRPIKYAVIKIANVGINLFLNIFFLVFLPKWAPNNNVLATIYHEDVQIGYIFISNVIASLFTLIILLPDYIKLKWSFNTELWK
ncbi:MAG: polysaccharide biosynthesis protein, partial [Flavobacterium sp.]|nr:polysaccharide biosynthesis protein [Flavobacterium sp.]